MSTHTDEVFHGDEVIHEHSGASIPTFAKVWFILLALTGGEVFLAYEQVPTLIMLTVLIGLSVIKAALIIAYFMHMKFERLSLFLTLFPMLIFCVVLMLIFLGDALRLPGMRPGA
jgi:cytochrome c oxidase subunit 4